MFCPHCGFPLDEGDLFCCRCGEETPEGRQAGVSRRRRLQRPGDSKKVAGVCAGIASYWNKDASIVRLLWTGASLVPPFVHGPLAYGLCWALMPSKEKKQNQPSAPAVSRRGRSATPHS